MYSREKCERRVSQPRCRVSVPSFLDTLISNGNTRLGTPAIFRQNELIGNRASLPSANRKIDLARTPHLLSSIDASTPIRILCQFFLSFFLFSFFFFRFYSTRFVALSRCASGTVFVKSMFGRSRGFCRSLSIPGRLCKQLGQIRHISLALYNDRRTTRLRNIGRNIVAACLLFFSSDRAAIYFSTSKR